MKNINIGLFFFIIFIIFLFPVMADAYVWISPKKGQGSIQMAEDSHVDPGAFIALNKKLGNYVKSNRPSLVYSWQKFAIPGTENTTTKGREKIEESIKIPVQHEEKEYFPGSNNVIANEEIYEKERLMNKGDVEKKENRLFAIMIVVCGIFFLTFILLYVMALKRMKRKVKTPCKFEIFLSDKFSGYYISSADGDYNPTYQEKTLDEVAAKAAELARKYLVSEIDNLFSFKLNEKESKTSWRLLNRSEKEELLIKIKKNIING